MSNDQIKLTVEERIFLANQYRILEKLYPEDAKDFEQNRIIVESGYELHYWDLNSSVSENPIPEKDCRHVMDVLDMYRALKFSYDKLDSKEGIDEKALHFDGFDGNNETKLMFYTQFLVIKQGRWQELIENYPVDFHREFNSHGPRIDMYKRMLEVWNNLGRKFDLTHDEIRQILDAMIHPENR